MKATKLTRALAATGAISMANILSPEPALLQDGGNNKPGIICMANDSRFVEAHFSEPLTSFAVGWKDGANLEALLEFIAPEVQTSRRFQYGKADNAEEFLSETGIEDVRAIGGDFKRVEYTQSKVDSSTLNKGLTIRVDLDQVADNANWQQIYTAKLMRRLLRAEIRRSYALLVAAATAYTDGSLAWSNATQKDPDTQLMDAAIAYGDVVGVHPARILFGLGSWSARRKCYAQQNTASAFAAARMTADEVAQSALCRNGYVSGERYTTGAATKGRLATSGVVLLYDAEAGQTPEDSSNIKRFVSNTDGGTRFKVFAQQINAKLFDITVEHYSRTVVTSTLGIKSLTVT